LQCIEIKVKVKTNLYSAIKSEDCYHLLNNYCYYYYNNNIYLFFIPSGVKCQRRSGSTLGVGIIIIIIIIIIIVNVMSVI